MGAVDGAGWRAALGDGAGRARAVLDGFATTVKELGAELEAARRDHNEGRAGGGDGKPKPMLFQLAEDAWRRHLQQVKDAIAEAERAAENARVAKEQQRAAPEPATQPPPPPPSPKRALEDKPLPPLSLGVNWACEVVLLQIGDDEEPEPVPVGPFDRERPLPPEVVKRGAALGKRLVALRDQKVAPWVRRRVMPWLGPLAAEAGRRANAGVDRAVRKLRVWHAAAQKQLDRAPHVKRRGAKKPPRPDGPPPPPPPAVVAARINAQIGTATVAGLESHHHALSSPDASSYDSGMEDRFADLAPGSPMFSSAASTPTNQSDSEVVLAQEPASDEDVDVDTFADCPSDDAAGEGGDGMEALSPMLRQEVEDMAQRYAAAAMSEMDERVSQQIEEDNEVHSQLGQVQKLAALYAAATADELERKYSTLSRKELANHEVTDSPSGKTHSGPTE